MIEKKRKTSKKGPRSKKKCNYIFVVGGVMSGVGKGITTASIGTVLQSKGFTVSLMKADPYLNVDAGTMNPTEHGEVFVLGSGLETDQDMGNYERFLNQDLPAENYMTNGMIFKYVIDKERALGYKGKCVEPTFHITEEILRRIEVARQKTNPDFMIIEVGGTVGEYQNAIFLEAGRQLRLKQPQRVMFAMVSYLPTPSKLGEMKTKPTQNAVLQLNSYGINPTMIFARSEQVIDRKRKEKIANMCGVKIENIVAAPDVDSIYKVPVNFDDDGMGKNILEHFGYKNNNKDLKKWRGLVRNMDNPKGEVKIAICGKYFDTGSFVLSDAYISIIEALKISSYHQKLKPVIDWVNVKDFEDGTQNLLVLKKYDGVLIPGGFGESGIEGKIKVIEYVRNNKIPYFGICYGMQLMVIEYARNVLNLKDAHTHEVNPKAQHLIIDVMEEQKEKIKKEQYGGSMRLGDYDLLLHSKTRAHKIYADYFKEKDSLQKSITDNIITKERHRHRYEVNPKYIKDLESAGLVFSGTSPNGVLMEIAELSQKDHPFFIGTQFHPEFLARPLDPHPLFSAFIKASAKK